MPCPHNIIEVVAAIIFDERGRIFATQRGYGEWKDWWEFPGGKIEAGETSQQALKREIHEELDAEIEVGELLRTIDYDYPNFHLTMHNSIDCPCTKEGCPRHGICCACVAHHKEHGNKLPACLRGIDWQS